MTPTDPTEPRDARSRAGVGGGIPLGGAGLPVAGPGTPYAQVLRGALVPSALAGAFAVLVMTLVRGTGAVPSALIGMVLALAFFGSGMALLSRLIRDTNPVTFVAIAMAIYLGQVVVLLVFLLLFYQASWLDPVAFGAVVLVVTLAWQVFQVRTWRRARVLVYDPPAGPPRTPEEGV